MNNAANINDASDFCHDCNVVHTASTAWECPPEPVEIPADARRHDCGRVFIPANATYCWFCHNGEA